MAEQHRAPVNRLAVWQWRDMGLRIELRLSPRGLEFRPDAPYDQNEEDWWVDVPRHLISRALLGKPREANGLWTSAVIHD